MGLEGQTGVPHSRPGAFQGPSGSLRLSAPAPAASLGIMLTSACPHPYHTHACMSPSFVLSRTHSHTRRHACCPVRRNPYPRALASVDEPDGGALYAGKRAVVVGAGPAGSTAAMFLARQGFQVEVRRGERVWGEIRVVWRHRGTGALHTRVAPGRQE